MTTPALTIVEGQFAWEHKFRPGTVEETILPSRVKTRIKNYINQEKIPSFLFYSPSPGTGKTTTALAIIKEIGCKRPLIINASLKTDIGTIRNEVVQYAQGRSLGNSRKVVFLDECDRLSDAAQESLKGLMESVSKSCTFILTTNNISRVNGPLMSRCRRVDFIWTEEEQTEIMSGMYKRCIQILNHEGVKYDGKVIACLIKQRAPDNRSVMGTLQDYVVEYGEINEGILRHLSTGSLDELVRIMKAKKYVELCQWCTDNANIGPEFYPNLTRLLCGDVTRGTKPIVANESIPLVIVTLGQEQKDHNKADVWLQLLQVTTTLMMTPEIKFL